MKRFVNTVLIVVVVAALLPGALVNAQGTEVTVTMTEAQINSSFRVTNPPRRTLTNVSIDLLEGQASVAATITTRGRQPVNTVSVWTPSITSTGSVAWTLVSATANGQPLPPDLVAAINSSLRLSLNQAVQAWIRRAIAGPFRVTAITISGDVITCTAVRG